MRAYLVTVEDATTSVRTKIVMDGIEIHPFHPEIEDDWLLVHQVTDP
jgi:hypothetical protein